MATADQTKTIVGVFNSVADAQEAVREVEAKGVSRGDISVVANKNATGYDTMEDRDKASDVVADAGIGAAIGGVGGLLLSAAGALTIPVIGPVLAAGPIAAALTGAGIGAAAGGLIGALTESGIPEEDAKYYAEGVRRGDVLVTVKADARQADAIGDILDRNNAVDVDERVQSWRNRGWSGWDSSAEPYDPDTLRSERDYYRAGKDPAVSGQIGGIGREALPTSYDERPGASSTGGGTESGYAGQPSGHVSGSELTDETRTSGRDRSGAYGHTGSGDATNLQGVRDRSLGDKGRELRDEARDTERRMENYEREENEKRRRRSRVYDRTFI